MVVIMTLIEILNGENGFYFFRENDKNYVYYIDKQLIYKIKENEYLKSIEKHIPYNGIEHCEIFSPIDNIFNLYELISDDWIKTPNENQIMLRTTKSSLQNHTDIW
jgi:hypothetical protein